MFTELILQERNRTDLEIVGENEKQYLYKFTLCGHEAYFTKTTKIGKGFRCVGCYENKVQSAATKSGLEIIHQDEIDNNRTRAFKFKECGHIRVAQVHDILKPRNIAFECRQCKRENNQKEASLADMVLLRDSTKEEFGQGYQNYKLYRFNACGHEQFCQPTHVRRNNIKCNTCFNEELKNQTESFGYELLCKVRGSIYKTRAKDCGHEFEMYLGSIRARRTDRCPVCYEEKIAEECKDFGLEMIGPTTTHLGQYRKYKFVSCGHTIDTAPEAIRDNRFECKPCIEAEFLSLIEPQGLKVLPKKSSNGYRWFSLPCGCEKEIRMEHARNGNWICGNCDDSYYTKDSNLYLVQYELDGFSWLKFGFARNLELRFNSYGVSSSAKKNLLIAVPISSGYEALKVEKEIHSEFKKDRLDKNLMMKYHKHNGHTECYPTSVSDKLIQRIKEVKIE